MEFVTTLTQVSSATLVAAPRLSIAGIAPAQLLDLRLLPQNEIDALYIHVPFCSHKCHYCDFYSITRQTSERMTRFVDLTIQEAKIWATAGMMIRPRTIFLGGGTPTALPPAEMQRLLRGMCESVDCSAVEEWTVEANPATIDAEYCSMLRDCGVNRISFGAQSFDRAELQMLERHHDTGDVQRSVDLARAAGFERINVDLIFAIPGQDVQSWNRSLNQALAMGLTHLSCYGLTYESNTAMTVRKRLGHFSAVPENIEVEMFELARERMKQAGLQAYEISNFATAGQECRHNLHYWNGGDYAAFGPSAASHVSGTRFRNPPHLGEWENAIAANRLPAIDIESLTPAQRAGELIMLKLRLPAGVRFDEIRNRFAIDARELFSSELSQLSGHDLIIVETESFRLSEKGLILADAIAAEFIIAQGL